MLKYLKDLIHRPPHPPRAQKSDISEQTIMVDLYLPNTTVIPGVAKVIKVDKSLGVEHEIRVENILYGVIYERIIEDSFSIERNFPLISINNYRAIQLPSAVMPPGFARELQVSLLLDDNKGRKLTGYNPLYLKIVYGSEGIIKKLKAPGEAFIFEDKQFKEWPTFTTHGEVNYVLPITSGTWVELSQKIHEMEILAKIGDSFVVKPSEYWYPD